MNDRNLSPEWVSRLVAEGHVAVHWSSIGDARAADTAIMEYARVGGFVVFTHDLDFGTLLALTHANGPSVIQMRAQDIMPVAIGDRLCSILRQYEETLGSGALLTIDDVKARVRILPI